MQGPIWTNSTVRPCFIRSSYSHSYCFKHPTMGNLPYKWPLTLVPKNTHLYTGVKLGFFKWYAQNSKSTQSGLPNCFHVGDLIKFLCSWCLTFDKVIISLGLTVTAFIIFHLTRIYLLFTCFAFFLYFFVVVFIYWHS